jgi:hypothetical protein
MKFSPVPRQHAVKESGGKEPYIPEIVFISLFN